MKIQLTQRDIETAMATYVAGMGLNGTIDSMSFTRTRSGKGGESGFLVDIEIFRDGEHKPLAAAQSEPEEEELEPEEAPAPKKAAKKAEPKAADPQEDFAKEEEAPFTPSAEDEAAKAAQTAAEEAAQDAEAEQEEAAPAAAPIASTGGKSLFTSN